MQPVQNPGPVRSFLETDPVGTAFVLDRGFQMEGPRQVFAVGKPPRAVLTVAHPPWADGAMGLGLHAEEPRDAAELIEAIPPGPFFAHLTGDWMLPLLRDRASEFDGGVFWLFRLDPSAFVDREGAVVRPLGIEWAGRVAKEWSPEWDATRYVRQRIEHGPAYAVFDHDEPVAWALTHVETPTIMMVGMIHVLEAYRRKGFARSVASAVIKDVLRRGKTPALHVKTDNLPSLGLIPTLGFRRIRRQVFGDGRMP